MFKKMTALLCVIIMVIGCFVLSGCGSKKQKKIEDGGSWDGTYVGREEKFQNFYSDAKVDVGDGYMMITLTDYSNVGSEDEYSSKREGEGKYKISKDGKSISITFSKYYTARLRKVSKKYFLSIVHKESQNVSNKYEVSKGDANQLTTNQVTIANTKNEVRKKTESKQKKPKKKTSSISSDFKETMDEYEDFIDKYCKFMKKYKNASAADQASMISDYSDMMSQYSDLSSKMSKMKSNLSGDELAYYTKVMSRVAKKLSKVS